MMNKLELILVGGMLVLLGVVGYQVYGGDSNNASDVDRKVAENEEVRNDVGFEENETCVPTFVDGGGPYYQADAPFREMIAPETNAGQRLIVSGQVLLRDCTTPLSDAVVDVWQANESGNYEDEWYRGQVRTDADGRYRFETVIPLGYGEGTAYRPPHIHFKIWKDGGLMITSQMFLPASRQQGIEEAYIMDLEWEQMEGKTVAVGGHDIVLP